MKTILICSTALFLAACTVPTTLVCDRESQPWDKFNTQSDVCAPAKAVPTVVVPGGSSQDPKRPTDPDRPVGPDPDKPKDPPKDPKDPPKGQNPGNDKPVGNAPYDGVKGEVPSGKDKDKNSKPGVKSDNSDANGKGGNKHEREDKTLHGTEVAELKKY
jgi:hypothetical protein